MAAKKVRVLGVHGLGHQEVNWFENWKAAIRELYPDPTAIELEFLPVNYDPIFKDVDGAVSRTATDLQTDAISPTPTLALAHGRPPLGQGG